MNQKDIPTSLKERLNLQEEVLNLSGALPQRIWRFWPDYSGK